MDGETKAAIEADCKTFLEGFSKTYATNYKSQLVNKLLEEGGAEEGEEDGPQLASPPSDDSPLRTGLVTKRGAVRKNWKQRFFVVKPNFTVDYYESEAKFEAAAKPKGCMVLNGYSVVRDPNARKVDAKTEMYKKLDLEEEAGEYTKYEPLTLELFHPSRRRWLMKFTEQADFDSWADTFEECCRKVDGRSTDDEVTCGAYDAAFGKCQEDMGLADHTYKGSEADMLTDLLYDDVDRKHLGAVREKLPGQGKMKVMAEGKMSSAVRAICNGLAVASWKTMVTASDASRPKVEEGLGAAIGPVRTAKGDVVGKTTEATSSVTAPVQEKVLVPVAAAIAKPVLLVAQAMFRRAIPVFQAQADAVGEQAAEKGDVQAADLPAASDIKERLSEARGAAGEAADTLGSLMGDAPELPEPVMAAINKIESVLNLKEWMQDTEDMVQSLVQKAIYTYRLDLAEAAGDNPSADAVKEKTGSAQAITLAKYHHDATAAVAERVVAFLDEGLGGVLKDAVVGACQPLLEPLDALIPEAVKEFISVGGCFEEVLENILGDVSSGAVDPLVAALSWD